MSKTAMRQHNFHELRAEFSERLRSNGDYVGHAEPTLFDSLKSQFLKVDTKIAIAKSKPFLTDVERREMEDHIRTKGGLKQLERQHRRAFEHAFIVVAKARLPKQHFLAIADEARAMWRDEGYADGLPIDHKKERKNRRRYRQNFGHKFKPSRVSL